MNNLQTVDPSEIHLKTPEEKFDDCILNEEPFMPDTAIYYLSLRNGENPDLNAVVADGMKLLESADMILDAQMAVEQAWTVFCKNPEGKAFSEKFVNYAEEDKGKQEERGFKNLVTCLDKTNSIINSTLNPNGA